jgi:hypothetical protein
MAAAGEVNAIGFSFECKSPRRAPGVQAEEGFQQLRAARADEAEDAEHFAAAQGEGNVGDEKRPADPGAGQRDGLGPQEFVAEGGGRFLIRFLRLPAGHQADDGVAREVGEERFTDDAAVAHDRDVVADVGEFVEFVRDVNQRDAAALEFGDHAEEHVDFVGRERRGGFIENEHAGVFRDGAGDFDELLLADAEIGDERGGCDREVETFEDGSRRGVELRIVDQAETRAGLAAEENILGDREVRDEIQLLENDSDAGGKRGAGIGETHLASVEMERAGVGREDAGENVHQRGFARAVFAEQGEQPAGAHAERNTVEGAHAREGFRDAVGGENDVSGVGHQRTSACTGTIMSNGSPASAALSGASAQPTKWTVAPTTARSRRSGRTFFSTSVLSSAERALNSWRPGNEFTSSRPQPSRTVLPKMGPIRSVTISEAAWSRARRSVLRSRATTLPLPRTK